MKQGQFIITENQQIAENIMRMRLLGETSEITAPGQFINLKIEGLYLRRPISVCDLNNCAVTIIYKIVGHGTEIMSRMKAREQIDALTGLGNGYDTSVSGNEPILLGGGVGVPPLYLLAKKLIEEEKKVTAILGFNKKDEAFYIDEFQNLGVNTVVTTVDGSLGRKGFVSDIMNENPYSNFYTCGPERMLKAVFNTSTTDGQLSFERRMGCGFGACMGCSCKTVTGNKRICKEGPVMKKEDIIWED